MTPRYRIRRVPGSVEYRLWDTEQRCYVNKFGEPDEEYRAANKGVATMRRRYLNTLEAESKQ